MQHSNSANCLADELLGAIGRLEAQLLPASSDERDIARMDGAKSVIDLVLEVLDRRLPSGPNCTCSPTPDDRSKETS